MTKLFKETSILVLAGICLLSLGLMLHASLTDSGTMDELAHIPSGYSYVRYLDFRLNPEHPPLVKAIAAFPLLFQNLKFPTESKAWTEDVNGQWDMGSQFLYDSGNNPDSIIRWSRLGPMLLTLLLIILIYIWARELLGPWWALLPSLFFGLSPSVLAHGHYVTTDVGAALGILLASYFFVKYLHSMSKRNLLFAGLTFGIAQSLKFSAVLLIPFFIFLMGVFFLKELAEGWRTIANRSTYFTKRFLKHTASLIAIIAIGYLLVVYPLYFIFTVNYPVDRQVSDTTYILKSFAHGPTPPGETCIPMRCLANLTIEMSKHYITRPFAHYTLGVLMVIQRSAGGNTAYFLGEIASQGWVYYFPVVYLLKEPLPVLIMIALALILSIRSIWKTWHGSEKKWKTFWDYLETNFAEFAMISFLVLYWAYSMHSTLNIGFRHLFPTLPLVYILTSAGIKKWLTKIDLPRKLAGLGLVSFWIKQLFRSSVKYLVMVVLVLWFVTESLYASPHFLSYFNEVGGGITNGYKYATDSNYDWGQDLLRLEKWVKEENSRCSKIRLTGDTPCGIDKIAVDYFGAGNPKYYLGEKEENWSSWKGNPKDHGINYMAISINSLEGSVAKLAQWEKRNPEDEYRWLVETHPIPPGWGNVPKPDFRIGTTLFVYKL